jgi:hypothetical protein
MPGPGFPASAGFTQDPAEVDQRDARAVPSPVSWQIAMSARQAVMASSNQRTCCRAVPSLFKALPSPYRSQSRRPMPSEHSLATPVT